jgi:hypothetical protein
MINEQVWIDQIVHQLMQLHAQANIINAKISNQRLPLNQQHFVKVCVVDAANLDEIALLASTYQQVHLVTEQDIVNQWPNVIIHRLPHSLFGIYYLNEVVDNVEIKKEFNCFLNRVDPVRQTWFYLLYARNLLDNGFVSFNMYQNSNLQYPGDTPEQTFDFYHKKYLSSFDDQYDSIKKIVPYKNFVEPNNLCEIMLSTKFSIVVETYFERTDCRVFTEKTWRALQLPRPWLLFAATGCVQKLRNMGFDVFDDYVNHDYDLHDTAHSYVKRQEDILSEAQKLFQLEITPDILDDWNNKAQHNRKILQQWSQEYQQNLDHVMKNIKDTVLGCTK